MYKKAWVLGLVLGVSYGSVAGAAGLHVDVVDEQGKPVADAVITLRGAVSKTQPAATTPAIMDQRNTEFAPHVLAIRTGTSVIFPNSDNIRHQVYSFSPPKRFELRLYQGTPSDPILFDKPGVEVLGCNIHDWMLGYVYVTDDPWFAVSGVDGKVAFDALPAGHYTATLWHPQTQDMQVVAGGDLDIAADVSKRYTLKLQPPSDGSSPPVSDFDKAFDKAAHDAAH